MKQDVQAYNYVRLKLISFLYLRGYPQAIALPPRTGAKSKSFPPKTRCCSWVLERNGARAVPSPCGRGLG
jgi:hypothetical protein